MKKQLRLLTWILSLTMLCELLPFSAFAQSDVGEALASTVSTLLDETNDIVDSGTCGDNVTWSFSSDGTLTLSGTGRTYHYPTNPNTNLAFGNIADEIQIIIINDGITTIGTELFSYLDNLLEGKWSISTRQA